MKQRSSSDLLITVESKNLDQLFAKAAKKLSKAQVNLTRLKERSIRRIEIADEELDILLFKFLSELIFLKDAQNFLGKKFFVKVEKKNVWRVKARINGDIIKSDPNLLRNDVKAITYHKLEVKKKKNGWRASVVADL
jgi:SHS2 domain-containing protein